MLYQEIFKFIYESFVSMGKFASWLFTPIDIKTQILHIHITSVVPIAVISVAGFTTLFVVHAVRLFLP